MGYAIHNISEGFWIAFRALFANKTRALLTTLGISIGVITVTLMMMIIQGLNTSVASQLEVMGSGTVYIERHPWIIMDDWWRYRNRPRVTKEQFEEIKRFSKLAEYVGAYTYTGRPIAFRNRTRDRVGIIGVTPATADAMSWMPEYGRYITDSDMITTRKICVIGADVKEQIFEPYDPMGRNLRVGPYNFKVVGILEKKGSTFGQSNDNYVMIPFSTLTHNFGHRRDVTIAVKAKDPSQMNDLIDELTWLMRRARNLAPNEDNDFSINDSAMLTDFYKRITAGIYAAGVIIGGISLLVGGIGIMNIMLVSVTERTWEIGMRKAVGARTTSILWQFLVESMIITMIGGIVGILVAMIGGKLLGQFLPTSLPLWLGLSAMAFSAVVGLIFGLFPAVRASRLDPIVALRQE
ncbi:MAG: ABC transporter permease [Candidatus Electryonea clarkiae]|nr:ABC transporter permease [Candidatus Electryonea clarkiae]MDP8287367.1 ABC transporter permease [Candidatus Electryonea clarkiae]